MKGVNMNSQDFRNAWEDYVFCHDQKKKEAAL